MAKRTVNIAVDSTVGIQCGDDTGTGTVVNIAVDSTVGIQSGHQSASGGRWLDDPDDIDHDWIASLNER